MYLFNNDIKFVKYAMINKLVVLFVVSRSIKKPLTQLVFICTDKKVYVQHYYRYYR